MKTTTLLSVVIPVHNGEPYVAQCLENLLGQTYKNLEIIVVDDGSTDQTAAIARRYPVRLIEQDKRGVSAARNAGIDAATGAYLHFMDIDDAVNETFYEKLLDAILPSGSDIACSCMINEPKPHRTLFFPEIRTYTETNDKFRITRAGRWGNVMRYLFRTDFLKAHLRFDESLIAAEDLIFMLQAIFLSRQLVTAPGAVYTYIRRENSTMTRTDREHRKRRYRNWQYAKAFRQQYARQNGFKIPGIPTGQLSYLYVKWLT
jgi:glycosyltransferase involved in cell wall biosynthesis